MQARGIEALVVRSDSGKWDSGSAAGRYLTQIGGNGEEGYVVFDLHEDPTFLIWGPGHIENWLAAQDWTTDIRPSIPTASEAIATRLKELDVHRAQLGVVGRVGVSQLARDGQWPELAWRALVDELPSATFVDFDTDLAALRAVKSAEEIACTERAMVATEVAVSALYEHARAGTQAAVVTGRIVEALIRGGSEMCLSVLLGTGTPGRLASRLSPQRALVRGDVIRTEIAGKYAGYWAQAHVPLVVGEPPSIVHRLFAAMREGFDQALAVVRPGASAEGLVRAIREPAKRAGYPLHLMPAFKGIGLAISELPEEGSGMASTIEENMLITLQPTAYDPVSSIGLHMADTVLVTSTGGRRLGRRSLDLHVAS
jgi:Xaa-Pro aminopeptidase